MLLNHWLSKRLGVLPLAASRRKAAARLSCRPTLEVLEERRLFSVLTVLNNSDSAVGSLRSQIAASRKNDTIVFAPSLSGQTITLTTGELLIDHILTITEPGAGQLTISGNKTSRVFEVAKGKSVVMSGLTISNGQALVAGGILNYGTLVLSGCTMAGNSAAGSKYTAGSGAGGAIDNDGTLTVSGSTLSNNSATLGGGGIANGGTVTISNSFLSGNSALNDGGGINNDGTMTISGSTLSNNTSAIAGGGIINGGTLTISGGSLTGNTAIGGNAQGGAILNIGTLTVSGATLSGNHSSWSGGAILTARGFGGNTAIISNCIFSGNSAGSAGGAIDAVGGTLTVSSDIFSANVAATGGGIYVGAYGTVIVENSSSITGNIAPAGFGADVYNLGVVDVDKTSIISILDGYAAVLI